MVEIMAAVAVLSGVTLLSITSYYKGKAAGIVETRFTYSQEELRRQWRDAFLYRPEEDEDEDDEDEEDEE